MLNTAPVLGLHSEAKVLQNGSEWSATHADLLDSLSLFWRIGDGLGR